MELKDENHYLQLLKKIGSIKTERLLLRPFSLDDLDDVFEYAKDPETVEYLTWYCHKDKEETKRIIETAYLDRPNVYCIQLTELKKCIGCFDLRIDAQNEKASFGYVLNRSYWNKGYMTETLKKIIDIVFNELNMNRIEANHYAGNEKSGHVMSKSGLKLEGTKKEEVKIKGVFFDVVHYGLIRKEYMQQKKASGYAQFLGGWTEKDADSFNVLVDDFNRIDEDEWK